MGRSCTEIPHQHPTRFVGSTPRGTQVAQKYTAHPTQTTFAGPTPRGTHNTAPNPDNFCGANTTWDAVSEKCTALDPASICPTDFSENGVEFKWTGEKCIRRVLDISEIQLPENSNPPYGYKAKDGSGPCQCTGHGGGLFSCGDLCCAASPISTIPTKRKLITKIRAVLTNCAGNAI